MVLACCFESLMKPGEGCKLSQQIRDLCKRSHGESEHSQALCMPSEFIVAAPLVNSQGFFDPMLSSQLRGQRMLAALLVSHSSHTFFPQGPRGPDPLLQSKFICKNGSCSTGYMNMHLSSQSAEKKCLHEGVTCSGKWIFFNRKSQSVPIVFFKDNAQEKCQKALFTLLVSGSV